MWFRTIICRAVDDAENKKGSLIAAFLVIANCLHAVFFTELINTTSSIQDYLFTCVERMRF